MDETPPERIQEQGGWDWSSAETKTDYIRRVRGIATYHLHDWPTGRHSMKPRCLLWAYCSSSGKKELRVDIQSHQHCGFPFGSPYSSLTPWGLWGILQGLTSWNLIVTEKWGKFCYNQHSNLGRPSCHLQCSSNSPNQQFCLSTESRKWHRLTIRMVRSAWFRSLKEEPCHHWCLVSHSPVHHSG